MAVAGSSSNLVERIYSLTKELLNESDLFSCDQIELVLELLKKNRTDSDSLLAAVSNLKDIHNED